MPQPLPHLILRADADPKIGAGHLFRCLALALEWKRRGGAASFVSSCEIPSWNARIKAAGFEMRSPKEGEPSHAGGSWLVVDGYHFDTPFLKHAREKFRTLVLDDYGHRPQIHADVLLNQNLGAEGISYPMDKDTLPLMGARFAMLRPEFKAPPSRVFSGDAKRILVSLGGADPDNVTAEVVRALPPSVQAIVVLGAAYRHEPVAAANVEYKRDVSDIQDLMAWADFAVLASGTTAWEACFMGLPSILMVLAENQERAAQVLAESGAALKATRSDLASSIRDLIYDPARREQMSVSARKIIDGRGASRVAEALIALSTPRAADSDIVVRQMQEEDVYDVWRLANEPAVRANSFTSDPIPLDTHRAWYKRQISDPNTRFYAALFGGVVAAQARYVKQSDNSAEVHLAVRSAFNGKGIATSTFIRSGDMAFEALSVDRIWAYVIQPNPGSSKALEKAGYKRGREVVQKGRPCAIFEKVRR